VLPALMNLHTGQWLLREQGDHLTVTSRHTVAINEANVTTVLGDGASVADARAYVRTALSTNSLATLRHAKDYAQARRR
jgi:aromatase